MIEQLRLTFKLCAILFQDLMLESIFYYFQMRHSESTYSFYLFNSLSLNPISITNRTELDRKIRSRKIKERFNQN